MSNLEHLKLSNFIKDVHRQLREDTKRLGCDLAWKRNFSDNQTLETYSDYMKKLSQIWENSSNINRIKWIIDFSINYYQSNGIEYYRKKELEIWEKIQQEHNHNIDNKYNFLKRSTDKKYNLLDVGSCYNPFANYKSIFEVTAIDISPSINSSVYKCDFLHVQIGDQLKLSSIGDSNEEQQQQHLIELPKNTYHIVVFSLFLEYLPTPEQRLYSCKCAYELLQYEGILMIVTPDSKHSGANARLMKNWRFTLARIGFSRIKIEKLTHLTCMVFRKSLHIEIPQRWSRIYREHYMTETLNIPQDFRDDEVSTESDSNKEVVVSNIDSTSIQQNQQLFMELPNLS